MSRVDVIILSEGRPVNTYDRVVSVEVMHELDRIPYARLVLLDGDLASGTFSLTESAFFEPGKTVTIKVSSVEQNDVILFEGQVIGQNLSLQQGTPLLTVGLKDRVIRMTRARHTRVFARYKDSDAIKEILAEHGISDDGIFATGYEHPELVQYDCSDWDFMVSRAQANGLMVSIHRGRVSILPPDVGRSVQEYTLGQNILDFEMRASAADQYSGVESVGWDIKTLAPTAPARGKAAKLKQGNLKPETLASAFGDGKLTLAGAVPFVKDEGRAWANAVLNRSRLSLLRGRVTVAGDGELLPLRTVKLKGFGARFDGETLISAVRQRVTRSGWRTDVQFGLSPERFTARPDVSALPAAGLLPAAHSLQIGLVQAFDQDQDGLLRVRVRLGVITEKAQNDKKNTVWARLAMPGAGKGRGLFFYPEVGDEVVVGFFNDDPRQPVILGAMFSQKNPLPQSIPAPDKNNNNRGLVSRAGTTIGFVDEEKARVFIETPAKNTLVLDDSAEGITLTDQHGNKIIMDKSGVQIVSAKDVSIKASGKVEISGQTVDLK